MIDRLLQIIAPHYCYGCGILPSPLCPNCKYDIEDEPFSGCVMCAAPTAVGICHTCSSAFSRAWCVSERSGPMKRLINAYKFERVRSAYAPLADSLDASLPELPRQTVLVPVPTIAAHIRIRGYDQVDLICHRLATRRSLPVERVLTRASISQQRGHSRKERFDQARAAFRCDRVLDSTRTYMLIDDVITTGATITYAAQALRNAGAKDVWIAVLARQPLDKS